MTYNSNSGLARHVARQLETHCRISTKLDVVDIPQNSAGMVSEAAGSRGCCDMVGIHRSCGV